MEFDAKKLPLPDAELAASHASRKKAALKLFDGTIVVVVVMFVVVDYFLVCVCVVV
jgi:hypothetical protein